MSDSNSQSQSIGVVLIVTLVACLFVVGVLRLAITGDEDPADRKPIAAAPKSETAKERDRVGDDEPPSEQDAPPKPGADDPAGDTPAENPGADVANDPDTDSTEEAPNEPKATVELPWKEQLAAEPEAWRTQALRPFNFRTELPTINVLKQWIEAAPRTPAPSIRVANTSVGRCGMFSGVAKLRPPVEQPIALRLQLQTSKTFQMHLFHGENGVTLSRHTDGVWSGYQTQRNGGAPRPSRRWLAATDDSAFLRDVVAAPLDVCILEDAVALTRGDVELLRVSVEGLASDVFFEGEASLQGVAVRRITDGPQRPERPRTWKSLDGNALPWSHNLPESASFAADADDSVYLQAKPHNKPGFVWAPLPDIGLSVVEVDLADLRPGAGVFLGQDGEPRWYLRLVRNTRDGELCAALRSDHSFEYDLGAYKDRRINSVPDRLTVRFIAGGGLARVWVSPDRKSWAFVGYTSQPFQQLNSIGLAYAANVETAIRVRRIRTAPLQGLESLADDDLVGRATACSQPTLGVWHLETHASQPPDVELKDWRRATAIQSLRRWTSYEFGEQLTRNLLDESRSLDAAVQQDALLDAALLLNLSLNSQVVATHSARLEQAFEATSQTSTSEVLQRVWGLRMATRHRYAFPSQAWLRDRILRLIHERNWTELSALRRHARLHGWERRIPLLAWVDSLLERNQPSAVAADAPVVARNRWPTSVVEELDREAFNVTSELYTALEADNPALAADVAAAIRDSSQPGLAPSAEDPRLLISVSAALNDLARRWPDVTALLEENHSEVARLRLQRAIDEADAAAVRTIAEQYAGYSSGGDASVWLGDHYLSIGRFTEAAAEFKRAARSPEHRETAAERFRLAASLAGVAPSEPTSKAGSEVDFSSARYSGAEFQQLIARLRGRTPPQAVSALANPAKLQVDLVAKLDGQLGKAPNQALVREGNQLAPNWPIRQLSTTQTKDILYVSNRFQIAAYNVSDGKRKWVSENAFGEPLRSQDWFLTQTQPLIEGDAVYCRLIYNPGPMLVRLNRADGKTVWSTELGPSTFVVSDPWLAESRLMALVVRRGQQNSQLYLAEFDTDTGKMQLAQRLFDLRDSWWRMRFCTAAPVDGGFLVATSGATAFCGPNGNIRWLRRHEVLPADLSSQWCGQRFRGPQIASDFVLHLSPGHFTFEAIELATGRLRWSRMMPNARGVLSLNDDRAIVRTQSELVCLDPTNGALLWRRDAPEFHHAFAMNGANAVMLRNGPEETRRRAAKKEPQVVWLDPATGDVQHVEPLPGLTHAQPYIGPIIPTTTGFLAFYSAGRDDVDLDLVRMQTKGPAETWREYSRAAWTSHINAELDRSLHRRFPQWQLWHGASAAKWGVSPNAHGEKDVLTYLLNGPNPVIWSSDRSLDSPARLQLRICVEAGMKWRLEVYADHDLVHHRDFDPISGKPPWTTVEASLPKRESTRRVVVRLRHLEGGQANIHIKQIVLQ